MSKRGRSLIAAGVLLTAASGVRAAISYTDNFNVDTSANYNVYVTAGAAAGPSSDATFAYDYGAAPGSGGLSIPSAPHTSDGSTLGLRLRADNLQNAAAAAVDGAASVATKNL